MKKKIVLLQHYYNEIGGIETFLLNFCKRFSEEYDITLLCRTISVENALEIGQYANVICEPNEIIKCDICIITSVLVDEEYFKLVNYKQLYQMIHSDWSEMRKIWDYQFIEYDKNTKYISVSEGARKGFLKEYGKDSVVIPNLVETEDIQLRLLSCTRLTEEKGYKRMCQLCDILEENNISYIWEVYGTNHLDNKNYGNMILNKPIKKGNRIMPRYDYVVQLSDTESFCLTMYESLMQGVPVLVTPFPNAKEDIKNGENGYILPFDMKLGKKEINNIVNKIPKGFKYEQKGIEELWKKTLK